MFASLFILPFFLLLFGFLTIKAERKSLVIVKSRQLKMQKQTKEIGRIDGEFRKLIEKYIYLSRQVVDYVKG